MTFFSRWLPAVLHDFIIIMWGALIFMTGAAAIPIFFIHLPQQVISIFLILLWAAKDALVYILPGRTQMHNAHNQLAQMEVTDVEAGHLESAFSPKSEETVLYDLLATIGLVIDYVLTGIWQCLRFFLQLIRINTAESSGPLGGYHINGSETSEDLNFVRHHFKLPFLTFAIIFAFAIIFLPTVTTFFTPLIDFLAQSNFSLSLEIAAILTAFTVYALRAPLLAVGVLASKLINGIISLGNGIIHFRDKNEPDVSNSNRMIRTCSEQLLPRVRDSHQEQPIAGNRTIPLSTLSGAGLFSPSLDTKEEKSQGNKIGSVIDDEYERLRAFYSS